MRIIMLAGNSKIGKSTTLNKVYDVLKNDKKANIIMEPKTIGNPVHNDFDCIFKYKGKTVRIYSMGDFSRDCWRLVKEEQVEEYYIDILVMAYNTTFKTKLDEYIKKLDHKNVVIRKNVPTDADNAKALDKIIAELEQAIADIK